MRINMIIYLLLLTILFHPTIESKPNINNNSYRNVLFFIFVFAIRQTHTLTNISLTLNLFIFFPDFLDLLMPIGVIE
jgi:hypothetical protein